MICTNKRDEINYKNYVDSIKLSHQKLIEKTTTKTSFIKKTVFSFLTQSPLKSLKQIKSILRYAFITKSPWLTDNRDYGESNYFSNERIAVYTCITGCYDKLVEPVIKPNNVDYYAITDFEVTNNSAWTRIDINKLKKELSELSNINNPIFLNRYFKMFPNIIFKNYTYSIYVDGNLKIYTDLTEYLNRLSNIGFSTFRHSQRTCVYKECEMCVKLGKADKHTISKQICHLKTEGMPVNYGMCQCSVIVREHNKPLVIKLMNEWWKEFRDNAKRDQLSLPLVLYKNNIKVDDITTLGSNIYTDSSFEIIDHN